MMRRFLVLIAAFALLGGACVGSDEIEFRKAKAGASRGGTLAVAIDEPASIDPPATNELDAAGSAVVETMCDRLIELDPITGSPKPAIAESWIISDRGRRLTVKLRRGVKFHNGRELVAEDVVFSLSRIADRDFAGPSASIMQPVFGYEQVHGNEEVEEESQRTLLAGLRVIENYSFEVRLTQELGDYFRVFSHVATSIVPKQEVKDDPDAFARRPICAGPYRMTKPWSPGKENISLERFASYYEKNEAFTQGGGGYADAITFKIYPDRAAQALALAKGTVHIAHIAPDSELATTNQVVAARTPTLEYIGLPTDETPFDRRGVRIAFSQAIDRRAITKEVYGGLRDPAAEFLHPSLGQLHRPGACGGHAPPVDDIEAARRSLRTAGADLRGSTIKMYFNDEFDHRRLVEALSQQWTKAFGAKFKLVGMKWESYADMAVSQEGFDGPFRMSWSPNYLSAGRYFSPLFESSSIGQNNYSRYSSRDFDRRIEREARRALNDRDQREEYQRLEDVLCGEMPAIPLDYGARLYAIDRAKIDTATEQAANASGVIALRELWVRSEAGREGS